MSLLRVECFSVSIDGYGAGPRQSLEQPLGEGGEALHEWMFADKGAQGVDSGFVARGFANVGAWILGRNMFGPVRGSGEALLADIDLPALAWRVSEHVAGDNATHGVLKKGAV
jgi:dihydrofolate reductase